MGRTFQPNAGGRDRRPDAPPAPRPTLEEIRKIIVDGDVQLLVDWADKIGQELAHERLSTNQIRNVFGTVRQIQLRWSRPGDATETQSFRDAMLLIPKLGYFAEREVQARHGQGMKALQVTLEPALRLVGERGEPHHDRFIRFAEFFEAIVAYHKKYDRNQGDPRWP